MLLPLERGFGCALLLWMEIQPLGCCFDLHLRLLVVSVPGSPAGGRNGVCLTLDQVTSGSSASAAEFEFWRSGALCWFPVHSTLRQLKTSRSSSGFSSLLMGFSSSHCWSLLHWRHLSVVRPASAGDLYLSGLLAGDCCLPLQQQIHVQVCLSSPPSGVADGDVLVPLMLSASTGILFIQSSPLLGFPLWGNSAGLCRSSLASPSRCLSEYAPSFHWLVFHRLVERI